MSLADDYLGRILRAHVSEIAIETPLDRIPRLSARLDNTVLLKREGLVLSDAALQELQSYFDRTIAFYEEIVDRARRNETDWLRAIQSKAQYLATEADGLRDANLQRLASQRAAPGEGIFFNDLLVAMRRIRNHALNMAEAFLGKK